MALRQPTRAEGDHRASTQPTTSTRTTSTSWTACMHVDSWEMSQDLDNARARRARLSRSTTTYFARPLRHATVDADLQAPAARRAVLGSHGARRALRRDPRIPTFFDRRLVRRLPRQHPAHARAPDGAQSRRSSDPGTTPGRTTPYPKPRIEWRREAVRWFDQWLKGIDTGHRRAGRVSRCSCAHGARRGRLTLAEVPGRWRYEDGWPTRADRASNAVPATEPHKALSTTRGAVRARLRRCVTCRRSALRGEAAR